MKRIIIKVNTQLKINIILEDSYNMGGNSIFHLKQTTKLEPIVTFEGEDSTNQKVDEWQEQQKD